MVSNYRTAACVLIVHNNKVLAVNRPNSTTDFCLPGGKVDEGEITIKTAQRELFEETGFAAGLNNLEFIFSDHDGEYITYTYLYTNDYQFDTTFVYQGDVGPASWVTWEVLETGPFGNYCKKLHTMYNLMKGIK
jgi:8-oxo-dGTP pyrophosphatase MutT (NUDIX family)